MIVMDHFMKVCVQVKKHLLWGYINKEGRAVIEPRYEFAEQFKLIKNGVSFWQELKKMGNMDILTRMVNLRY